MINARWSSPVARLAHNQKVGGSNPSCATTFDCPCGVGVLRCAWPECHRNSIEAPTSTADGFNAHDNRPATAKSFAQARGEPSRAGESVNARDELASISPLFISARATWCCDDCNGRFLYAEGGIPNFCPYCRSTRLSRERLDASRHHERATRPVDRPGLSVLGKREGSSRKTEQGGGTTHTQEPAVQSFQNPSTTDCASRASGPSRSGGSQALIPAAGDAAHQRGRRDIREPVSAVPIGHANAKPSRWIWRKIDCWAENTIANALTALANAGQIQRRQGPCSTGGDFRWLFWREEA